MVTDCGRSESRILNATTNHSARMTFYTRTDSTISQIESCSRNCLLIVVYLSYTVAIVADRLPTMSNMQFVLRTS
jgi:hypothetical protein